MRKELRWFLLGYGVPFVVLYALLLFTSRSRLPLWRRALTGEDTCPYLICFLLPFVPYAVVRALGPTVIEFLAWRRRERR